jgi:hypothetical protein
MNERILRHVEELFMDAPQKRRIAEIREELLSNMNEKFNDLVAEGKSEDEAFGSVVAGIGDIGSLIDDVAQIDRENFAEAGKAAAKTAAMMKAIAIGLYIIGVAVFLFCEIFNAVPGLGLIIMLSIFAVSTALLIYSFTFMGKKYKREDDTFVEEYKEKISVPSRDARLKNAASSSLWLIVVIAYLLVSFLTWRWDITWIIFLVGVVLQQIIIAMFAKKFSIQGLIWTSTVIIYFVISFLFSIWHISWIIFLVAAALTQVLRLYEIWREK